MGSSEKKSLSHFSFFDLDFWGVFQIRPYLYCELLTFFLKNLHFIWLRHSFQLFTNFLPIGFSQLLINWKNAHHGFQRLFFKTFISYGWGIVFHFSSKSPFRILNTPYKIKKRSTWTTSRNTTETFSIAKNICICL